MSAHPPVARPHCRALLPCLFISHAPERDHFVAVEYGRSPDGQPDKAWQNIEDHAAFLHDGFEGPIVGFGVDRFSSIDIDDARYAPLWAAPRFTAPLLGLSNASAAEIILAARPFLAGRRTMNRQLFDAAVDAQHVDPHAALGLWLRCLESGDAMAHFSVGYTLYGLGRFHEAYRHLRHYTELAPANPWNWRWYGRAAEGIGEDEEAVRAYERAIELSVSDTDTDAPSLLLALLEREGSLDLQLAGEGYARLPMSGGDEQPEEPILGERFEDALAFAARTHRHQRRKGGEVPYVGHLLGVCSLVIEDGGTEDEAIAALLHDAVEDQGGEAMLEDIRGRYGSAVADIVLACSDTLVTPKPPWQARKEAYLAHLGDAPDSVLRVSLADKLYNARSILRDYELWGEQVWERFNQRAGRDGQLWYYGALAETFTELYPSPMAFELHDVVKELRDAVASA